MLLRFHKFLCFFIIFAFVETCLSYTFLGNNCRTGRYKESCAVPLIRHAECSIPGPCISSPIVINDTIYIGSRDSSLYALFKEKVLWKFKTRGWIDATVTYKNGELYVGSRDGLLYILNAHTGDSLAVIENNNEQCASPLVYDSMIVFGRGGWNTHITAYARSTANYIWFKENSQMVYSTAAQQDSILCYGDNGGGLTAINSHTGTLKWKYQTGGGTYLSSPSVENARVWFSPGGYDYSIYALSLSSGDLLWKQKSSVEDTTEETQYNFIRQLQKFKPSTREKMIESYQKKSFINGNQAQKLLKATRTISEYRNFVSLGGIATSSVAVGENNVFVVHKEYGYPKPRFTLNAFNKNTGEQQWYFSEMRSCTQLGFCSTPMVVDTLVFVGWGEGKFYAFGAQSGRKVWEDSLDSDILSTPYFSQGKVYVTTLSGKIYSYVKRGYLDLDFENNTYCYPNPARNAVSHIQVYSAQSAHLRITVYNFANRPIVTFEKDVDKGTFTYDWNVSSAANGVYFAHIQLKYGSGATVKKILNIAVLK